MNVPAPHHRLYRSHGASMNGLKGVSLILLGGWGYHLGDWVYVLLAALVWLALYTIEEVYFAWRAS